MPLLKWKIYCEIDVLCILFSDGRHHWKLKNKIIQNIFSRDNFFFYPFIVEKIKYCKGAHKKGIIFKKKT